MELDEAEQAAVTERSGTGEASGSLANVVPPRDPVEEWERRVRWQFANLRIFARENNCLLSRSDLPAIDYGKGGMEHEIFHCEEADRFWKSTFPGQAGFGPAGYSTPFGYLRRLRISNRVFADDVQFEGIWKRREGLSIVTSQPYILPDPENGIPTEKEIDGYMKGLDFVWSDTNRGWRREVDGVLVLDCHPRNYIKTIDEEIIAIDVQPVLLPGFDFDSIVPT